MTEEKYIEMGYYCKSKTYLYPLLGFSRNEVYKPEGSYLFFLDHSILSNEIITYYKHGDSELYNNFERTRIAQHPGIRSCYRTHEGTAYVFDLSEYKHDINRFLEGSYSQMSEKAKTKILQYMGDSAQDKKPKPGREAHAVLYPELYYDLIAKQLGVPRDLLSELASIFDLDKETLTIESTLEPAPC